MKTRAPSRCAWLAVLVVTAPGCSPGTEPSVDASLAQDVRPPRIERIDAARFDAAPWDADLRPDVPNDGPTLDAYDPRRCVTSEPGSFGSACRADGSCDPGLTCGSGATTTVRRLDGTVEEHPLVEGICTARCDPDVRRSCPCGTCVTSVAVGTGRASIVDERGFGVCLQPCWPDVRGGPYECLGGYACDAYTRACIPPCDEDRDCLYGGVPGGGEAWIAERPEELVPPISCGSLRGECVRRRRAAYPRVGDPCDDDLDCCGEDLSCANVCWAPAPGAAGSCAQILDCEGVGGCSTGQVCMPLEGALWVCARP